MAKTTRKIDSQPLTIGELFRRPVFYRVPAYQRDFAWTSEQIDNLWEDIIGALQDGRSEYFLGAIVVSHTDDEKKREVVDGQQRLATISMIFSAISKSWSLMGDAERSIDVSREHLGTKDRRSGEIIPKLTMNEANNQYFQSFVIGNHEISSAERKNLSHSNKLLVEAFERIKDKLTELAQNTDKASRLLELEEFIATKANIILIEAGDESDAFITFETLNDRGLDLAISDLIKNFLFSKAGANLDLFKTLWAEIVLLIGGDSITQFLRYFWNAEYETARERELYKSVKNIIHKNSEAKYMIETLRKYADLYDALSTSSHPFWADFPGEYRDYHRALSLFKVTQYRPVVLAAMNKFKPDQVAKILRMMMVISFRYTIISSLNTGNLEKIYSKAALAITGDEVHNVKEVFEILKPVYVDDNRFMADFRQKQFTKDDIARYILKEINNQLEGGKGYTSTEKSDLLTVEHIFPKNPREPWKKAIKANKDPSDFVYLIGNLSLLDSGKNRAIGNSGFEEKKEKAFKVSALMINKDVADSDEWTLKQIEERSRKFARIARQIWRLDF